MKKWQREVIERYEQISGQEDPEIWMHGVNRADAIQQLKNILPSCGLKLGRVFDEKGPVV